MKTVESPSAGRPVVVAGAGPIGIEMAVRLKKSGLDCVVMEAGWIGNTMAWWAPQTRWFSSNERMSIAGVPLQTLDQSKATREEYLCYLRGVVKQFDLDVRPRHAIGNVEVTDSGLDVHYASNGDCRVISASKVVLAIGGTDHARRLGVPGEDLPHVDGFLRELHQYCGRDVLVVGGRNSAVEAALRLHHVGARVSLCYRGETLPEKSIKYWLMPEMKALLKSGRIQGYFQSNVRRITPHEVEIENASGEVSEVVADDVLTLIGYEQDKSLFRSIGVRLEGTMEKPVFDPETMETNVPGVYVAGTATAGTQSSSFKTFLENCHIHVERIANDIQSSIGTVGASKTESGSSGNTNASLEQMISMQPES